MINNNLQAASLPYPAGRLFQKTLLVICYLSFLLITVETLAAPSAGYGVTLTAHEPPLGAAFKLDIAMEQTKKPTRKNAKATPGDVLPEVPATEAPTVHDPVKPKDGQIVQRGGMGYVLVEGIGWVYRPNA